MSHSFLRFIYFVSFLGVLLLRPEAHCATPISYNAQTPWAREWGLIQSYPQPAQPFRKIVIYSPDLHIGSTLINPFQIFAAAHLRFPSASIEVQSPLVNLLKPQTWLTRTPLPPEGAFSTAFVEAVISAPHEQFLALPVVQQTLVATVRKWGALIEPETLFVLDADGLYSTIVQGSVLRNLATTPQEIEDMRFAVDNVRLFVDALVHGLPRRKGASVVSASFLFDKEIVLVDEEHSAKALELSSQEAAYLPEATVYQITHYFLCALFGYRSTSDRVLDKAKSELFFPDIDHQGLADFRRSAFGSTQDDFIIVNVNTFGDYKLHVLAQVQSDIAAQILTAVESAAPHFKIILTPLEVSFAATPAMKLALQAQHEQIRRLVQSRSNHVAILPDGNKGLLAAGIIRSRFVISQDSGFVHVANYLKDPMQTLVFSADGAAGMWHELNQPYVSLLATQEPVLRSTQRPSHYMAKFQLNAFKAHELSRAIGTLVTGVASTPTRQRLDFVQRFTDLSLADQLQVFSEEFDRDERVDEFDDLAEILAPRVQSLLEGLTDEAVRFEASADFNNYLYYILFNYWNPEEQTHCAHLRTLIFKSVFAGRPFIDHWNSLPLSEEPDFTFKRTVLTLLEGAQLLGLNLRPLPAPHRDFYREDMLRYLVETSPREKIQAAIEGLPTTSPCANILRSHLEQP